MQWSEESISPLSLNGLPWPGCWSTNAAVASRKRQPTQRAEGRRGWTGTQETRVLGSHSSVTVCSFDFRLRVSSGPYSSHISNGGSNRQSDFSLNGPGILLSLRDYIQHSTPCELFTETPLDLSLYPSHPPTPDTQYRLLNKFLMNKWMHDFLTRKSM